MNIHDILERSKAIATTSFASNIKFIDLYDPSLPCIDGHFDQLVQIFLNLFKNSAEAVSDLGGSIKVCTSYQSGFKMTSMNKTLQNLPIRISIIDNGMGISKEISDKIFEPFVSTKRTGSGLGLSLVSKIVADHGGSIECQSEPGKTIFEISLPLSSHDAEDISDYGIHSRLLSKNPKER